MTSPVPWLDMRGLIEGAQLGVPISWPNEANAGIPPEPPAPWLVIETTSDVSDPIEIGAETWKETGTLYVHVLVPAGSGLLPASQLAKSVANVFRGLPPRNPWYGGASIGVGQPGELDGNYYRLSVSVAWTYQDRSVSPSPLEIS